MPKPYIVFFVPPGHGVDLVMSMYALFKKEANIDTTLIQWDNKRKGLSGEGFKLGTIKVNRKPNVLVVIRSWWPPESGVAGSARDQKIPVVMINHGAMCVFNQTQKYKRSIYPAIVNCLWGQHDLSLWRRWNKKDTFIVTGNPLHDQIIDYTPSEIKVPDEFALLLTPRMQRKFLNPSAEKLNKIIPVVAKTHPIDDEKAYYKKRYLTYDASWTLLPLMYKAKLIIADVSSAWIPALFWQKPIFIHSFDEKYFHFSEFKDKYPHVFNFKQDDVWNSEIIDKAIKPDKKHFEIFGHLPDGKNSLRVAKVIKSYVK